MNTAYFLRLAGFSLASFFAVNVLTGLLLALLSPKAIRFAEGMEAKSAARLLFALKIAPAAIGLFAVFALCIPSYLWLEPESAASEELGIFCLLSMGGAVALWLWAIWQSCFAIVKSERYLESCAAIGKKRSIAGESVLVVRTERTTVLAGLLRPVILISPDVLAVLSREQLEAAVRHERSHAAARDNLKRLAMLLAPELVPLRRIDQAWRRYSEWAADDCAVAGNRRRSMALAEALVRVARLGGGPQMAPLATPLLGEDLAARVDRLIHGDTRRRSLPWKPIVLSLAICAAILFRPSTLDMVHRVLEKLID